MRYNERRKIDLAVNEIFDYKGTAMIVKIDDLSDNLYGCDECELNTEHCPMFECLGENRTDKTDVHFEKLKEVKYENN